jgi:hypothetical protein
VSFNGLHSVLEHAEAVGQLSVGVCLLVVSHKLRKGSFNINGVGQGESGKESSKLH